MDDDFDMGSALTEISEGLGLGDGETVNEEVVEPKAPAAGTPPTAPAAAPSPAPAPGVQPPAAPAAAPTGVQTPAPPPGPLQPPKTWRPEAVAGWEQLSPVVQAEVLKREEDMFKGLEGYKADAGMGRSLKTVLAPFEPTLRQYGIDPVQHIGGLMQAHHTLALGSPQQKLELFTKLARDYGVPLQQVAGGEAPYVDPQVQDLQREIVELKSRQSAKDQAEFNQERQRLQSELTKFETDPANVYFAELANDMAILLRGGVCQTLPEAYEKALWQNPAVRAKEQARLDTEKAATAAKDAETKRLNELKKVTDAKRAMGANLKTSAKSVSAATPHGSLDDTLSDAYDRITAKG